MPTAHTASRTVSVIGLGLMGSALAEALLAAGHQVTVWNRSPAKAQALDGRGARRAQSAAAAIGASDVTIICLSNHAATMEILGAIGTGPNSGALLAEFTTMSAADSREVADWAAAHGMNYLEGSILGVPRTVTSGAATIAAAGPREVFLAAADILQPFGGGKHIGEAVGAAVSFDRVYYAFTYGAQFSFLQGAAMAHAMGFSVEAFTEVVMARINGVKSQFAEIGANIASRDHALKDCRADVWAAAFADTLTLCREIGVDDSLPTAITQLFQRNAASGRGGLELSSVFETMIEEAVR